jgi:glycosyltransferase involved in cell wall biosynthesis
MKTTVDIIVPVHNRWEHTKQTLLSLIEHTRAELYELYVIDDFSTEEVRQALIQFKSRALKKINLFRNHENIGPGASRNKVCDYITSHKARSKYLYHSDNDVFFRLGWLDQLIAYYEKGNETILSGKLKLLGGGCHPYLQNNTSFHFPDHIKIGVKDAVSGYSQLMEWETWDKYGPFDETMRGQEKKIMGSEDWAFCQKIIQDGFLVGAIEPELVIATGKTNTYGEPATGSDTFKEMEGVIIK